MDFTDFDPDDDLIISKLSCNYTHQGVPLHIEIWQHPKCSWEFTIYDKAGYYNQCYGESFESEGEALEFALNHIRKHDVEHFLGPSDWELSQRDRQLMLLFEDTFTHPSAAKLSTLFLR
jgi:hypothetical protein